MAESFILDHTGTPFKYAHAADQSNRRGPQYAVRNDDIGKLINSSDRRILSSLSSRLYTNVGVLRATVDQKADYSVGEAWLPSYVGTTDMEDGKAVSKFLRDYFLPQCDTRGGVFDWWKLLELSSIGMDREGDVFWMFVKGADGFPRIQLIPGHRCWSTNGEETVKEGKFKGFKLRDGVIYYRGGRPAGYRINMGESNATPDFKDIPASDIIHLFDPTFSEQGRGLPAFTHGLEDLKTCLASTEDERVRMMIVSRLHLTVFNEAGGPNLDDPQFSLQGGGCGPAAFTTQNFPGGTMYLPADGSQRVEQMKHDNPGPIFESFHDRLIRMSVIGAGWSYSLVWKPTGQGTSERSEIVKARRSVTKRQGILWHAARRATAWAYSVFVDEKRVPQLDNPVAWDFSRPPRLTVDDGRESKMELNELVTGSRNLSEVLEARGLNEDEFLMARAWSVAHRKGIARKVSEEASKKYGVEITVDDREMFMQTPNEVDPDQESTSPPTTTNHHNEDH